MYAISLGLIKLSALCLFARVFVRTRTWFRPALYTTGAVVVGVMIAQLFVGIFRCTPVSGLWSKEEKRPTCVDLQAASTAFGVLDVATTLAVLSLPVPILVGLRFENRLRIAAVSAFAVGGLVCAAGIARLVYARRAGEGRDPSCKSNKHAYLPSQKSCI